MSIIGYDDIHASRFYAPPLTTIHQSKLRLGRQAVNILLERISHKDESVQKYGRIDIAPSLSFENPLNRFYKLIKNRLYF